MQHLEDTYLKAVKKCGTEYALAKRLGCTTGVLYNRRTKPISPEIWALIADIVGDDPREALIEATIERNADKPRGAWLREALGKSLAGGAAAITVLCVASAGFDTVALALPGARSLCIMLTLACTLAALRLTSKSRTAPGLHPSTS